MSRNFLLLAWIALIVSATPPGAFADDVSSDAHWVETQLLNPRRDPDDVRRPVKPPDWNVFGNQAHFTALRGFDMKDGKLVGYSENLERYTKDFDLGDVIWPRCPVLEATNIADLVAEIKRRNLYLYQIWGYVPGSGPKTPWPQFRLSPETSALFESQLGDRWLGMDMGEQDGRYVLGYARSMTGISDDRVAQYLNFHRYMEQIADDCGNKMAGLAAVSFSHYLGKEGIFTILGAETAQEHPNGQVFYSFVRGAGKQYGIPWFGNASIYNRWGWKNYHRKNGGKGDGKGGPTKGSSLALMKRLLYSHILYNSMIVGFEGEWLDGDKLSPIGEIQHAGQKWVRANGQPGVMQTPVAVMTDFYAGWIFPSYNSVLYRSWANLPFGSGDYLLNNVFGMIYPGYQDSSFFHDETGFTTPTPYGDAADVLLSDAPERVLERYPLLVVAGELTGGAEVRDKLQAYIEQGGQLYITAGSLKNLPQGLAGITVCGKSEAFPPGQEVMIDGKAVMEANAFELSSLQLPKDAKILARAGSTPAAVSASAGKGSVTVFASPFAIGSKSALSGPVKRLEDHALDNPYPMLGHVSALLDPAFRKQILFGAGDGLSVITCRRGAGDYVLGVGNSAMTPRPFQIVSHVGDMLSVKEIPLDQSEKNAVGYLPEGIAKSAVGQSDEHTIAGGDIRIFHVRVSEKGVAELSAATPPPPPHDRFLAVGNPPNLEEALLVRPTFFQHFDGVSLDWKYISNRERSELEREAAWLKRQKVRILVDLSSGVDLFPGFRLVNNFEPEYKRSLDGISHVIEKMGALGARDLVLTLHNPEGYFSREKLWDEYAATLETLCKQARERGVTVYLRNAMGKMGSPEELLNLADKVNAPNLKLALATGSLMEGGNPSPELIARLKDRVGFWLVSAQRRDLADRVWTSDAPLAGSHNLGKTSAWLRIAPDVPVLANAVYATQDDEYRDTLAIQQVLSMR